MSHPEELLEVLVYEGEPLVAQWARRARGRVRDVDSLARALDRLEAEGGPVAWSLAAAVRRAWYDLGGQPPLSSSWSVPSGHAPPGLRVLKLKRLKEA